MVSIPSDIAQAADIEDIPPADVSSGTLQDGERKLAEAALRESESVLRSFFDSAGAMRGIVELEENDILQISANALTAAFFGRTKESMRSKRASELGLPPESIRLWIDYYLKSQQTNEAVSFEYLTKADSAERWLSATVSFLGTSLDNRPRFAYVVEDVTERKRVEQEIQELLEREKAARFEAEVVRDGNIAVTKNLSLEVVLETLLEHLRKLIPYDNANVMLLEGESKFVVRATCGYEDLPDGATAHGVSYDAKTHHLMKRLCTTQRSLVVADTTSDPGWIRVAGLENIRNWLGVPLIAHGQVIGLYSMDKIEPGFFTSEHVRLAETLAAQAASAIQNASSFQQSQHYAAELEKRISELKQAEDALRSQKEILQKIFDHIPAMISFFDAEGRIKLVNREWERWRGWSLEEILSQNVDLVTEGYPDQEYRQAVMALAANSNGRPYNLKTKVRDGRVLDTTWSTVTLSDGTRIGLGQDITERKQAEDALDESRRYLQALFDNSLDGILVNDNEGRYIDANPAACALLGYTHGELIQLSVFDVTPEHNRQEARAMWQEFLAKGSMSGEYSTLRNDGVVVQLEFRAVANILPGVHVSSSRDVTERKRMEEELQERAADLAEAQRVANLGNWTFNLRTNKVTWSEELYRIFEIDKSDFDGRHESFVSRIHPDDRPRVLRTNARTRIEGLPFDIEYRIITPNNQVRIIREVGYPTQDEAGQVIRLFGTAQDITERKRAAEARREAEQKYRDIFDNALEGIFQTSPDGRFVVANPALARMFGFDSPEEIISERADISKQHYVDSKRRDEFKRLMEKEGVVHQFEYEAYRKDGSRIWVSDNVRAIRDQNGTVLCYEGIATDITQRKRAEARTAAFATLAGKLNGARVPPTAAQTIADTAQELFGWESCALKLYDDTQDILYPLLYIDTVAGHLTNVTPDTASTKPTPRSRLVIDHGAQLTLREEPYQFDEDSVPFGDTDRPSVSVMSVPIRHSSKVIGILSIQSYRAHAYDHAALGDLQALADHCGAALNRIRAEEALRESEERYRELFENAKDATYVHDLHGRYTSVNRAAEKLSGHTREEIIGRRFSDFVLAEQVEIVGENLCRKLAEEGETTYETKVIARDGRRVPVEVSSHLIYRDGLAVGVQGTARDITERKRAEEALRQSEHDYRGLFENAHDAIIIIHPEKEIVLEVNQRACEIYGFSRAEFIGLSLETISKNVETGRLRIKETLEHGASFDFETIQRRRDGTEMFLQINASVVEYKGQRAIQSINRDITDRKRADEALRQSEERFSKAFHSSPSALSITLLEDGRLLEVNAAFLRMTGFSRYEVIGRTTVELGLWTGHDRGAMAEAVRQRGVVENLEIKFHRKSGEMREGLLSAELIQLGAGPSVLGIAQDVTERNRAAEALQRYPRQLIEAQEAERQRIARELHDQIGQVLTAIHLNLESVWEICETPEARSLINEGVAIVDEALGQVRDLSFELRPSLLDDLGLVSALRWYSDRFSQRTGIRATTEIYLPESPVRLRRELETACFRIVQEALTNIVRHADARNVAITLSSSDSQINLSIKDDGTGFNGNSQNLAALSGCVGLRGMKERVLALQGKLEISSAPSRGTEIRAHFPSENPQNQRPEI